MSALKGSVSLLRSAVRSQIKPKAPLSSKPAKHILSTGEKSIAMVVLFATILVPSGWVLSHLEDYKKR